jgi:Ca2+-binding RTX toxin-like protein
MDHKYRMLAIGVAVATVGSTTGWSDAVRQKAQEPIGPVAVQAAASARPAAEIPSAASPRLDQPAAWPLAFVENAGQMDGRVTYSATGRGWDAYFTPRGVTYALRAAATPRSGAAVEQVSRRWVVRLRFPGSSRTVPEGRSVTPTTMSYFTGPRSEWATRVRTFNRVVYRDLWPGIDAVYSGAGGALKYSFVVRPGADPDQIRLAYRGARRVRLDASGGLRVSTPARDLVERAPTSYQVSTAGRDLVASAWEQRTTSGRVPHWGYKVGGYQSDRRLVIDPATNLFAGTLYAGYVGGFAEDHAVSVAADAFGAAYLTGTTWSASGFPAAIGPDVTHNGSTDAFVVKVRPDGSGLEYAGFIGGSGWDEGLGIAIDAEGAAFVTGSADSSESTFPVVVGPDLAHNGSTDAFVVKVRPGGTGLEYAGFIGGVDSDSGSDIAVDGSGAAYVTGLTWSSEATFPVIVGPDLSYNGQSETDGFVAKVSPDGTALNYAGYVGGDSWDSAAAVEVDAAGAAYLAGTTESAQDSFPVAVGPDLTFGGGSGPFFFQDGFVAKVRPDGTALEYAGYIGGSQNEGAFDLAVDAAGSAHVAGATQSSADDGFPVMTGPSLQHQGAYDPFIAKVASSGQELEYAGYLGSHDPELDELASGLALTAEGDVFVAIAEFDFETTTTSMSHLAWVDADPSNFQEPWGPAIGGDVHGLAADSKGDLHITGTSAGNLTTTVGPKTFYGGGHGDAFVVKLARCTLVGTSKADRLVGTAGRDVICGRRGNDTIIGGRGDDVIVGGPGSDTISFASNPRRVVVSIFGFNVVPDTATGAGADRLIAVENVIGTRFADEISGTDGVANRLVGGKGKDTIRDVNLEQVVVSGMNVLIGGAGDDVLLSDGDSRMIGGAGDDEMYSRAADDVVLGGAGDDTLEGRPFGRSQERPDQVFEGGSGDDTVNAGGGNDRVHGGRGTDTLTFACKRKHLRDSCAVIVDLARNRSTSRGAGASANTDRVVGFEWVMGGPLDDVIRGDGASNRLVGGDGGDVIRGAGGDDSLWGGDGNDRLEGGDGFDRCSQGPGRGPLRGCEAPRRTRLMP